MKSFAERNPLILGAVGVAVSAGMTVAALEYDHLPFVNSGTCWCKVPWRATLSSCAPRQMPRIGIRRR